MKSWNYSKDLFRYLSQHNSGASGIELWAKETLDDLGQHSIWLILINYFLSIGVELEFPVFFSAERFRKIFFIALAALRKCLKINSCAWHQSAFSLLPASRGDALSRHPNERTKTNRKLHNCSVCLRQLLFVWTFRYAADFYDKFAFEIDFPSLAVSDGTSAKKLKINSRF